LVEPTNKKIDLQWQRVEVEHC